MSEPEKKTESAPPALPKSERNDVVVFQCQNKDCREFIPVLKAAIDKPHRCDACGSEAKLVEVTAKPKPP